MQLGPHPRTRSKGQQADTLATTSQDHDEQPRAPVLAALWIAHHRPGAVIHLSLFPWLGLDDDSRFWRSCSAQLEHKSLNTLIAVAIAVMIDQILPDTHRVATSRQLQFDQLPVCFTGSKGALATLLRQLHFRQ